MKIATHKRQRVHGMCVLFVVLELRRSMNNGMYVLVTQEEA